MSIETIIAALNDAATPDQIAAAVALVPVDADKLAEATKTLAESLDPDTVPGLLTGAGMPAELVEPYLAAMFRWNELDGMSLTVPAGVAHRLQ